MLQIWTRGTMNESMMIAKDKVTRAKWVVCAYTNDSSTTLRTTHHLNNTTYTIALGWDGMGMECDRNFGMETSSDKARPTSRPDSLPSF